MAGPMLRAGAWPAVVLLSCVAAVVGGLGAAFPAAATATPVTPRTAGQAPARSTGPVITW